MSLAQNTDTVVELLNEIKSMQIKLEQKLTTNNSQATLPAIIASEIPPLDKQKESAELIETSQKVIDDMYTSRIILTTYPSQFGINPIQLEWGNSSPQKRGPIIVSRHPTTIKYRNAIGAHGGSYCIYRGLAVASGSLNPKHIADLNNTQPPVEIAPQPQWAGDKIVSFDPFGHNITTYYKKYLEQGYDVRPTIAITKAHMNLFEINKLIKEKRLEVDGKILVNEEGDLKVQKAAIEPVWYLPGVAKRFNIDENTLRRVMFEETGGMYPELITRNDLKVFLPPIGGLTIYMFGDLSTIPDPQKRLTVRVHDECNGSDVFGSDICTCRPYLIYGIEESVKEAQKGGAGIIIYFRKEGRALGEVTKYLVYNARKRQEGGDTASTYFKRTESVAGVKDMRFQALMPDALHWLGVKKIDRFISMSNMKYEAIVDSGIEIVERVPIPDDLIPKDSRVEIDAKIAAGYFSLGEIPNEEQLKNVKGRLWDDVLH